MKRSALLLLALLVAVLSFLSACGEEEYETVGAGELYVHFLDVGQADCTVLRTKDTVILVDAGSTASAEIITDYLEALGIQRIDCLVLTHPHEDHIGGAAALLSHFTVEECVLPNAYEDTTTFRSLLDALERMDVEVKEGYRAVSLQYGDIALAFFWPEEYPSLIEDNARSLVFRATFNGNSILFPGDAPASVEAALLEAGGSEALRSQLLKVGHHGAKTSTTEAFLTAVSPQYAVISCGRGNVYAYPHIELMTRLLSAKARIYRTDTDGTIVFRGDGATFSVLEK